MQLWLCFRGFGWPHFASFNLNSLSAQVTNTRRVGVEQVKNGASIEFPLPQNLALLLSCETSCVKGPHPYFSDNAKRQFDVIGGWVDKN